MKTRQYIFLLIGLCILIVVVASVFLSLIHTRNQGYQTEKVAVIPVISTIAAEGTIRSENEAMLNFQTNGKVVYLPFKEGDTVSQGQIVAELDQRTLQNNIDSAVKSYENEKISFDTVNDFNGDRALSDTGLSISARRQLETAVNTLDQTQIALTIQQIAKEQSLLTSPINGVITHEDISVPYVNITPATTFSIADPSTPVFRANVSENDIDFVSVGAPATLEIDGHSGKTIQGTVSKVYPQKTTLADGRQVYQVDIESDGLKQNGKLQQSGSVLINSNTNQGVLLVPAWTVLSHNSLWVMENDTPKLKQVVVGKAHGTNIEIVNGLNSGDEIIVNPESLAKRDYSLL